MKRSYRRYFFLGISSLLAAGLIAVLVSVKYRVLDLEDELVRLNQEIAIDRQAIHVLKAEWSHLNDPERLGALARRYLGLGPVLPEQMGTLASLPMRDRQAGGTGQGPSLRIPAAGGPSAATPWADRPAPGKVSQ